MPRQGRSRTESGPTREIRPVAPASPIETYRVADIPEILSLYLNAVEVALRNSAQSTSVPTDAGGRRPGAGKPPTPHTV